MLMFPFTSYFLVPVVCVTVMLRVSLAKEKSSNLRIITKKILGMTKIIGMVLKEIRRL